MKNAIPKIERNNKKSETFKCSNNTKIFNNLFEMKNKINSDSTDATNSKKFKFQQTATASMKKFQEEKEMLLLINNKTNSFNSNQIQSNSNLNNALKRNKNTALSKTIILKKPLQLDSNKIIEEVHSFREKENHNSKAQLKKETSISPTKLSRTRTFNPKKKRVSFKSNLVDIVDISIHKDDNLLDNKQISDPYFSEEAEDVVQWQKEDFRKSNSSLQAKNKKKCSVSCGCLIF